MSSPELWVTVTGLPYVQGGDVDGHVDSFLHGEVSLSRHRIHWLDAIQCTAAAFLCKCTWLSEAFSVCSLRSIPQQIVSRAERQVVGPDYDCLFCNASPLSVFCRSTVSKVWYWREFSGVPSLCLDELLIFKQETNFKTWKRTTRLYREKKKEW